MIIIGLAGSAAPAGAEPLAREPMSTVASGYGGIIAYSQYSAASRRYRLVARIGARVRVLWVRSRSAALAEAAPGSFGGSVELATASPASRGGPAPRSARRPPRGSGARG